MSLDQLYQQIILDHSKARHGSGLAGVDAPQGASTGQSHQLNPVCGDEVTLRVAVEDGVVAQISWDGAGCSISMASASVLSELGEGLTVDELHSIIGNFREVLRSVGRSTQIRRSSVTRPRSRVWPATPHASSAP